MASKQNKNALSPREATEQIRTLANDDFVTVHRTEHFKDRLSERDLLISDATHALKNGFVRDNSEQSTQQHLWKYKIESKTPNSGNREIGVIIIPDFEKLAYKLITIYWVDEK